MSVSRHWWRWPSISRSRIGRLSQRRRQRPPILVTVLSRMAARVCSWPPARFLSSSRFCRVAASRIIASSCCSVFRPFIWGRALFCVSFIYSKMAPAAPIASDSFSQPKPLKFFTRNCFVSCCSALTESKCHAGLCVIPARAAPGSCWSSSSKISAGLSRSTSPDRASSPSTSSKIKRPLLSSSVAMP